MSYAKKTHLSTHWVCLYIRSKRSTAPKFRARSKIVDKCQFALRLCQRKTHMFERAKRAVLRINKWEIGSCSVAPNKQIGPLSWGKLLLNGVYLAKWLNIDLHFEYTFISRVWLSAHTYIFTTLRHWFVKENILDILHHFRLNFATIYVHTKELVLKKGGEPFFSKQ